MAGSKLVGAFLIGTFLNGTDLERRSVAGAQRVPNVVGTNLRDASLVGADRTGAK